MEKRSIRSGGTLHGKCFDTLRLCHRLFPFESDAVGVARGVLELLVD